MRQQIDVIIPMYNSESYISGLLHDLENQTMKDFRAIFVDDGSTDNTYSILEDRLRHVSFAHILIHQENMGLPGARNTGIAHAQAPWITFLDSDDGLDPNHLSFLYQGVVKNSTHVGICEYQTISRKEDAITIDDNDFSVTKCDAKTCMKTYYMQWFGAWVLMLNREWLQNQNLHFDEECTYLEDVPFITQVIAHADTITIIHNATYLYYIRKGSLMRTPKIEKYKIALDGFHRMAQQLQPLKNPATAEFFAVGHARYYLATLRKCAILMPYKMYLSICTYIPFHQVRHQINALQTKHRISSRMYLFSKRLFYHSMRFISRNDH